MIASNLLFAGSQEEGDELLTTKQVAEILKIEERTAQLWLKNKTVPGAIQIGNAYRMRRSVLENFILELEREATVPSKRRQK